MRFNIGFFFLLTIFYTNNVFGQEDNVESEFEQAIEAFLKINYEIEDELKPANTVFFFDSYGHYVSRTSIVLDEQSLLDKSLEELNTSHILELEKESHFESFDLDQLKHKILNYSDSLNVNTIQYNIENGEFLLKSYKLKNSDY